MPFALTLVAVVFLPLFPFGMIAIALMERLSGLPRAALIALWPLPGVWALGALGGAAPDWLVAWAMLSALFYAWRGLAMTDARGWVGFLAVSAWPLIWAMTGTATPPVAVALSIGLPVALASLVVDHVEHRFGAAHGALDLRLASRAPGLAGFLFAALLAAVAVPPSPSFFALLALIGGAGALPTALAILAVWLLWSWSAARLIQGLVPGAPRRDAVVTDIDPAPRAVLIGALAILGLGGLFIGGLLL